MQHADFVHLHVHSQYSLLDGACHVDKLVEKAKGFQMPALALTDHGNLFGAVDFYSKASRAGVKPIVGCEVYVAPSSRFERSPQDGNYEGANHLTLLARNEKGYKNLMKLVTAGYLEGFYYKPRIDRELFAQHAEGLLALSGCLNSEFCQALLGGDEARAREVAGWYCEVLGREHFFLEIQNHDLPEQHQVNKGILKLSRALDLPLVATNDVHYLNAGDATAHEVLLCIQTGKTMKDPDRMRFTSQQFYLKSPAEMHALFAEVPDALKHTIAVAERCNLQMTFGKIRLPRYEVPEGHTPDSYLAHLAREGLKRRYPTPSPAVLERLEHELAVIDKTGFAGYFLVVWDFISFARKSGIPVGPGRGSAAGSLVSYCLGITSIDPLHYGLFFERFLNPERVSMPDMDIDFCYERRDEVIDYVTRRYGKDNVSQIITFGTMGAKAVIRDVARAMGLPYSEADRIAKLVPTKLDITLEDALAQSPPLAEQVRTRREVAELYQVAKSLEGLTRHASTHAAGVVISPDPLTEHVPLYKASKGDVNTITTQFDMKAVEKIGLLKMDFLGLRTLTVIADTLKLVQEAQGVRLDIEALPLDDARTFQLLSEGRTFGVFQLESSGMREMLRGLKPERLEDVIACVALYRPGPMDMIKDFIGRKHGRVKVTYEHPVLEKILRETYGIMVYQEQVMQIASDLAGFTMGQADLLRRAMGKKDAVLMAEQKQKFVEAAKGRGVPKEKAEKIADLIEQFAGYGFNKSHSAAYALVAYQTAYLKAHYPVEFMAALLTSEMADTDKIVRYIEECRQMGIEVLPPDVNDSSSSFTVVGGKVRFGLVAVKNVGEKAIQSILDTRKAQGRFTSLYDFCERVDLQLVNKRVLESLIKCGAFDSLGLRRAQLLAVVDKAMEAGQSAQRDRRQGQVSLLDVLGGPGGAAKAPVPAPPEVPEFSRADLLRAEKETLGFYITGHPLAEYGAALRRHATATTEELPNRRDKDTVTLGAIVSAVKEISTKSGDRMAFITLEDTGGSVEAIAFPELYRQNMLHLVKDAAVLVKGQLDVGDEIVKLLLSEVRPLADLGLENGPAPAAAAVGQGHGHGNGKGRNGNGAPPVEVSLPEAACTPETLRALRDVAVRHPGPSPLRLRLQMPGGPVTIAASPKFSVSNTEAFRAAVEALKAELMS
ncbi:MAG TPA: DNA polymerase III subunit alpha [Candidatus Sulfotelmatobacter sp.]|nr:DNA polymerase III subunit alpha [Candidatus Sulfotelmatobacter sp.]